MSSLIWCLFYPISFRLLGLLPLISLTGHGLWLLPGWVILSALLVATTTNSMLAEKINKIFVIIFLSNLKCLKFQNVDSGSSNFVFHNFTNCAEKPTPMNFSFTLKWLNRTYQVIDGYANVPTAMGNDFLANSSAKMLVLHKWVDLGNWSDNICRTMRNLVGPLRADIMAAVGLPADTCPIPARQYRWKNVHLDFKKSRIPVFPHGNFEILLRIYEIATKILFSCIKIALENKPL